VLPIFCGRTEHGPNAVGHRVTRLFHQGTFLGTYPGDARGVTEFEDHIHLRRVGASGVAPGADNSFTGHYRAEVIVVGVRVDGVPELGIVDGQVTGIDHTRADISRILREGRRPGEDTRGLSDPPLLGFPFTLGEGFVKFACLELQYL
jgi:hypothetical protein